MAGNRRYKPRKKVDPFVKDPSKVIDYKDTETLKRFISDRGKICLLYTSPSPRDV